MIQIPELLEKLVSTGRWPNSAEELLAQNSRPLVSPERVKLLAPDEAGKVYLYTPPFAPIGRRDDPTDFYNWPSSDPDGIDFDLAIAIGDFGMGSDAPIALDYRLDSINPRVIRLRYDPSPPLVGKWVVMAPDFATFIDLLGL